MTTRELGEGEATEAKKSKRGFAAMSSEKQREIASLGGKAAHAKGTAHEFTTEEARAAGRKGGLASRETTRTTVLKEVETRPIDGQSVD